jgi:hypothetical protein
MLRALLSCLVRLITTQRNISPLSHPTILDTPVSKSPDTPVESSIERRVGHTLVSDRLVEHRRHIDTVFIGYFPERSDDMPKPRELAGADKMDSFINKVIRLICASRASREIAKERSVLLEPVVTEVSYSQRVVLPIFKK